MTVVDIAAPKRQNRQALLPLVRGERSPDPVVPVLLQGAHDARTFAALTGPRLPSEAQWDYAARGGLTRVKFPWGKDRTPAGWHGHIIWQNRLPDRNSAEDGAAATAPVRAFAPNGYGRLDMTDTVWEWTAGGSKVRRGGSHLYHDSYCARHFVQSRSHNTAESPTGPTGFRLIWAEPGP